MRDMIPAEVCGWQESPNGRRTPRLHKQLNDALKKPGADCFLCRRELVMVQTFWDGNATGSNWIVKLTIQEWP